MDFKSLPCFSPPIYHSLVSSPFQRAFCCEDLSHKARGGMCKSFYTRGAGGPVQLAVCCWASLLTSLCFSCHNSKVGLGSSLLKRAINQHSAKSHWKALRNSVQVTAHKGWLSLQVSGEQFFHTFPLYQHSFTSPNRGQR